MAEVRFPDPSCITDELRMLRGQVKRFVDEKIIPHGEQWERDGMIPRDIFRQMGELGFLGMRHPAEYGGTDLGPLASMVFAEELARSTFGGVTACVTVHTDMSATHITRDGTAEQKAKYLPPLIRGEKVCAIAVTEPGAGSDVAGLRTRAIRDGDHWVINGSKTFITNGVYGDTYVVAARSDPAAKGSRGISLFIIEKGTPGFVVGRKLEKHGWRCSDTAELFFDDARVPAENLLGVENQGFYGIMKNFQNERMVVGAICAGESAKALELTLEHVRNRQAFGGTLWDLQATRQRLGLLAAKAAAARALAYQAAELDASGFDCVRELSMVKVMSAESLQDVMYGCLQLHGGAGYMIGTPVERMARDARILTIGGGATEVMLEEVAKRL
ncbi:acyl-CoA dehydrogenase family protein [Magnetospirillum sp. 15-1]|uniref:acyl-CoA dehydrogenase family protein n=1 Tax=Magnetospirillum sp. 15-1 TaxID=1979370 RepID=UPI000BBC27FC|nr:acyl-CoA dehydrogenase family protein [Magnetospirillum sp. 15-1]